MFYEVYTETGFPGFEPRRNYTLLEPEWTAHARLIGPLVLATRLRAGYALPQSRAVDLLPHKRFYAGGVNPMRGYERRRLGPLDEEGKPVGGIAKLESSVELRFPIVWRFFGALFVDTGEVWSRRVTIRPFDQQLAGGAGLMIRTPFGPIRTDLGFPITEPPASEPEMVWHFSVGQLF
jgi:outer membrane translocation and assembly module TamA